MQLFSSLRLVAIGCAVAAVLSGQAAPPRIFVPPPPVEAPKPAQQPPPASPAKPAAPAAQPAAQPGTQPAAPAPQVAAKEGLLSMNDVSLTEFIKIVAQMMKINYLLDPRVKGTVTLYT